MPQSWFSHFYLVGAVTNLVVITIFSSMLSAQSGDVAAAELVAYLGLFLLQIHLTRRLLESVLMFNYPKGARMHLIAYLFGLRSVLSTVSLAPSQATYLSLDLQSCLTLHCMFFETTKYNK